MLWEPREQSSQLCLEDPGSDTELGPEWQVRAFCAIVQVFIHLGMAGKGEQRHCERG